MKISCMYCSEISECSCPDHKFEGHEDAKYICDVCMELLNRGIKETELKTSPKRKEILREMLVDSLSELLAAQIADDLFDGHWQEEKEHMKGLSKKELGQECYLNGLHEGFRLCIQATLDGKIEGLIAPLRKELKDDNEKIV